MNYFARRSQEKEKGFSLIEVVIVVAVLSVLSAIVTPAFNCILRKSKAVAALNILRQIENDCLFKEETNSANQKFINPGKINGYSFVGLHAKNCQSDTTIRAVSSTDDLPSYSLELPEYSLTYHFKGMSGRNFSACLSLVCGNASNALSRYNIHEFVLKDAVISSDDGCSDYVIVNADSWEEGESNAQKLGGNLVTLNSQKEYNWIQQNLTNDNVLLKNSGHETGPTQLSMYFVGLNDKNEEGKYEWSSGEKSEWSGDNNETLIHRQNWLAQQDHANSHDHFVMLTNDCGFTDCQNEDYRPDLYTGRGVGTLVWVDNESTFYKGWNSPHFGIAEIPRCRN